MKREIVDEADVNAFAEESCDAAFATEASVRSSQGYGTSLPRICSNGRQLRDISKDALERCRIATTHRSYLSAAD